MKSTHKARYIARYRFLEGCVSANIRSTRPLYPKLDLCALRLRVRIPTQVTLQGGGAFVVWCCSWRLRRAVLLGVAARRAGWVITLFYIAPTRTPRRYPCKTLLQPLPYAHISKKQTSSVRRER